MDYLCELPNDAVRRTALDSLPPDLNSTYERILDRVNQTNPESQKLVRRALRWISTVKGDTNLTTEALCEAVSIDLGSTRRNVEAIPDDFAILKWCSSLVRKSTNGKRLELAHFTVLEFLQQIDSRSISIGAYRMNPGSDDLILAKVCLTYLNFGDFDQGCTFNEDVVERRFVEYSFRWYAVKGWISTARHSSDDSELSSLVQKLLSPSKPNTFISWMHDMTVKEVLLGYGFGSEDRDSLSYGFGFVDRDTEILRVFNSGFAQSTALHWAAMLELGKVCSWLIESGSDVNRNTVFGTPLHLALLGWENLQEIYLNDYGCAEGREDVISDTVDILLKAGANPNCRCDMPTFDESPLYIALSRGQRKLAVRLLDEGALTDSHCLDYLEEIEQDDPRFEDICKFLEHTSNDDVLQDSHSRLLELASTAETSNATRLLQTAKHLPLHNSYYEQLLRTAAELGQIEVVTRLLKDQKMDIDSADKDTGATALHHAAMTDQHEVMQILIESGADLSRSDCLGRTILHQSVQGRGTRCLQFLLCRDADTRLQDLEGMSIWHLAAQNGNVQALSVLLDHSFDAASAITLKANDGRTALLCASVKGFKEAMKLLLSAGSSPTDTALNGCSLLHYAAISGNLEDVEFLVGQAVDPCAVTQDGSSALHYAISNASERSCKKLTDILRLLLEMGVDPCKPRKDGCTPLHDLVSTISRRSLSSEQLDRLFASSRLLLKGMLENSGLASDRELYSELLHLACLRNFSTNHQTVLALLELGVDCKIPSTDGKTALMAATESGNDAILSTLILHGADPRPNAVGLNAVHCACFGGYKNILGLLRQTAIDWNSKATATLVDTQRNMVTALHIAAQIKDSSVLEYLLNENLMSDIDARTDRGETPLSIAVWKHVPQNVSLLLSNSADTTLVDDDGNSPIHWAAEWGFEDIIAEFISHGSNLALPNEFRLTPELVARKHHHESLAKIIVDYVTGKGGSHYTMSMNSCAAWSI